MFDKQAYIETLKSKIDLCGEINNIDILINSALEYVFSVITPKQSFEEQEYNGNGTPKLFLEYGPLISVEEVKIDDEIITDYTVVKKEGFLFMKSGTRPRGYSNIIVSYTAGYMELPADIDGFIYDMVIDKVTNQKTLGISSESIDDYKVVFEKSNVSDNNNVLDRYRRHYV